MAVDEIAQKLPRLLHLDREFFKLLRLRSDRRRLRSDRRRLRLQQRVATFDIVGKLAETDHGLDDTMIFQKRKSKFVSREEFRKYFSGKRDRRGRAHEATGATALRLAASSA